MRMWGVDPALLCDQHLLGEHVEMHMFAGSIKKGINVSGYVKKGLVEIHNIQNRHDELAMEIEKRGMNHKSDLDFAGGVGGYVDIENSKKELKRRCKDCKF